MKKLNFFALALLFLGAIACNNAETSSDEAAGDDTNTEVVEGSETEEAPAETADESASTEEAADSTMTEESDSTTAEAGEGDDHGHDDHAEGEEHAH